MVNTANKEKSIFVISEIFQNKTLLKERLKVTDAINNFVEVNPILLEIMIMQKKTLDNLWENFQEKSEDNLIILNKRIISLENGFDANVYPTLSLLHSNENSVG